MATTTTTPNPEPTSPCASPATPSVKIHLKRTESHSPWHAVKRPATEPIPFEEDDDEEDLDGLPLLESTAEQDDTPVEGGGSSSTGGPLASAPPKTKGGRQEKGRGWCVTCYGNGKDEWRDPNWDGAPKNLRYACWQREICPTTKRKHIQEYLYFNGPLTLTGVRKVLKDIGQANANCRMAHGTPAENKEYCSKEETRAPGDVPHEYGTIPHQGSHRTRITRACI